MKPQELVMFTSEIGCIEFNTLADEITVMLPPDLQVAEVTVQDDGATAIRITRKNTDG